MSQDPLVNALASLYLTFAHATDGELTADEMRTLAARLHKRAPDLSLEELGQVLRTTVQAYKGGGSLDDKRARAEQHAAFLRDAVSQDMREAIITDLAEIANADGDVSDEEVAFIADTADILGVELPE